MEFSSLPGASNAAGARVWEVGALCRAVADALSARFNPVSVRGELTGFSRAASGHCYFSIKDANGQIRCAMFKRAAQSLGFTPRDGELVEVVGKLGVYEQRGDLQLIVEDMRRAGQGALFEQFLRLKAQLEADGLFDAARKRPLPLMPRGIAVVTSLGAAALHDVVTALRRRVPQLPVVLAPALVQGAQAAPSMVEALQKIYRMAEQQRAADAGLTDKAPAVAIDAILLVRGGGSMEDLWAFNDETLARTIVQSPVPLVSGVGHETDFTIADFCADVRAPTPTAAAELVAPARADCLLQLQAWAERIERLLQQRVQNQQQWLDKLALRLGQPGKALQTQRLLCQRQGQQMAQAVQLKLKQSALTQQALEANFHKNFQRQLQQRRQALALLTQRLELLNPEHVLQRGFAWLTTPQGQVVSSVGSAPVGTALQAQLADGRLDLTVVQPRLL